MTNSAPAVGASVVIPDHLLGWGPVQIHTRYMVDAMLVLAAVGALFVSFFLISEPDVSALVKKAADAGVKLAPAAL